MNRVRPNIGRAIASTFAVAGATVLCNDVKLELAGAAAQSIRPAGGKTLALTDDVPDSTQVQSLSDVGGGSLATWGTRSQPNLAAKG